MTFTFFVWMVGLGLYSLLSMVGAGKTNKEYLEV